MKLIILAVFLLALPHISFSKTLSLPQVSPPNEVDASKPALNLQQEKKWSLLTGKWFGQEITKNGGRVMWIAERNYDGTYKIHFKITQPSGDIKEQIEMGEWGVSGPVYFTIFKARIHDGKTIPADPTDPYNRDAYKIISLSDEIFEYQSFDSDNKYTVKKVPLNFVFPK